MIYNVDTKDHNLFCLSKRRLRRYLIYPEKWQFQESGFVSPMDSA